MAIRVPARVSPRKVLYQTIRDYWSREWDEGRGGIGYFFKVDYVKRALMDTIIRVHTWEFNNQVRLQQDGNV